MFWFAGNSQKKFSSENSGVYYTRREVLTRQEFFNTNFHDHLDAKYNSLNKRIMISRKPNNCM